MKNNIQNSIRYVRISDYVIRTSQRFNNLLEIRKSNTKKSIRLKKYYNLYINDIFIINKEIIKYRKRIRRILKKL